MTASLCNSDTVVGVAGLLRQLHFTDGTQMGPTTRTCTSSQTDLRESHLVTSCLHSGTCGHTEYTNVTTCNYVHLGEAA